MQIVDLSYLSNISESDLILGSVGATVTANASATGSLTATTYVLTDTFAKKLRSGAAVAVGTGVAVAKGDNVAVGVTVAGEGDLVIDIDGSKYTVSKNVAVALGIVIAIDFPNKKG